MQLENPYIPSADSYFASEYVAPPGATQNSNTREEERCRLAYEIFIINPVGKELLEMCVKDYVLEDNPIPPPLGTNLSEACVFLCGVKTAFLELRKMAIHHEKKVLTNGK